jgi:uncharacterized membrane protein
MNKIQWYLRKEFKVAIFSILFWIIVPMLYYKFVSFIEIVSHDWSNIGFILLGTLLGILLAIITIFFCVKNLRTLYQDKQSILGKWFIYFLLILMFFMPYIGVKITLFVFPQQF